MAIGLATQLHPRAKTLALFLLSIFYNLVFALWLSSHGYKTASTSLEKTCPFQSRKKEGVAKSKTNCACPFFREIKNSVAH